MHNHQRVALGMSGGVDSSLSAHLLIEAGYDVTGVYLECWRAPGCRSDEDRKDALEVALQLGIPFQVLDFKEAYRQKVVENFFAEYQKGRTPNPDVLCNKEIKFGLFYDWAITNKFDFIATGHYAQIAEENEEKFLGTAADAHKDQTYFLYRLRTEQLEHILFPVGHLLKKEVRAEASKRNLAVAEKKDSVGICFIGDINVHEFLRERLGEKPGQVIDVHGHVIGEHNGLWFYTIGQRHGFTIFPKIQITQSDGTVADKHNIPPFYVVGKKAKLNQLVVGFGADALQAQFEVSDLHWIISEKEITNFNQLKVRIRHTGELHPCSITKNGGELGVQLDTPIQGLAEGQSAVFYGQLAKSQQIICLGGGVITFGED